MHAVFVASLTIRLEIPEQQRIAFAGCHKHFVRGALRRRPFQLDLLVEPL
jgi:hypothetical protein